MLHLPEPVHAAAVPVDTSAVSDSDIYDRLISAILDHRLEPGTKLIEDKLATAFGVSRTRIRPVLVRLANESIITLRPNRGAVVAQPTPQEAQEIFEVRRMIEPTLVAHFISKASDADIAALRQLIQDEETAQRQGDRHRAIRLSGQFHLWIAEKSGHQTLGRMLVELVSRTSLILMTYGQTAATISAASCGCMAHRALLDAIRMRMPSEAKRLMQTHLQEIENQLDWAPPTSERNDLKTLLGI
jgi:DNA-binding GntR family transcriptional regulator